MPKGQPTDSKTIDRIKYLVGMGMSQTQIAKQLGISTRTISEYAPSRLTPIKHNVLRQLNGQRTVSGAIRTTWELSDFDARRAGVDMGALTRVLHELRKAGMVTFVVSSNTHSNGHHVPLKRIEITPYGRKALGLPTQTVGHPLPGTAKPETPPVVETPLVYEINTTTHEMDQPAVVETAPVVETPPAWPLLESLQKRQAKVHAAAALLEEAGLLDTAVGVLDSLKYTDVEKEYMAYAEKCKP